MRDPLHVDDLTELILRIFDLKAFSMLFHAGGGVDNFLNLKTICTLGNPKVKISPGKNNNDFGFLFDNSRAQELGWFPKVRFIDWIKFH